jgi:hypothetical protein|tara:strand:- start:124 stop:462 length:339 start_codon:yes stop_codon:yes gene_type:complete
MRECNKCGKQKTNKKFKHNDKKTCLKCEFRFKVWLLRQLAYTNKLTPYQKYASRIGYMGSGFLIAAQWTIEPYLYVIGFCFIIVQTSSRKQWNLVVLNINGLIAWITHLLNT